ncbi:hypothetical protein [Spirobacillus cienkowskii]|uniref:hypothetical protein n=1 Tax=Spirobacillus cienkowskii TaxID=495820 RepID=UPI0030CB0D3F
MYLKVISLFFVSNSFFSLNLMAQEKRYITETAWDFDKNDIGHYSKIDNMFSENTGIVLGCNSFENSDNLNISFEITYDKKQPRIYITENNIKTQIIPNEIKNENVSKIILTNLKNIELYLFNNTNYSIKNISEKAVRSKDCDVGLF